MILKKLTDPCQNATTVCSFEREREGGGVRIVYMYVRVTEFWGVL